MVIDGWIVSLISKAELAYVPPLQKTGRFFWKRFCRSMNLAQFLAYFLSFNAFIPLNSVKFCNEHIYSEPQTVRRQFVI